MGKGGNANTSIIMSNENATRSTLELERKEKMSKAPDFHWASGDSMEEPHVRRSVLLIMWGLTNTVNSIHSSVVPKKGLKFIALLSI